MGVFQKLQAVQGELKAPKGQYNSFGKYKYRSCEDILEAAKPVLAKHGAAIVVSDEVLLVGERYYIKATATFYDTEDGTMLQNAAFAREPEDKKGMDTSQITGTASSYARKYALNGLLLIDDTKDADTDEHRIQTQAKEQTSQQNVSASAVARLMIEIKRTGYDPKKLLSMYKLTYDEGMGVERNIARLSERQIDNAIMGLQKQPAA